LSQAANLLEDAAPYLVISEGDIWKQVADRLPFTPRNLYFIQSLEVDFLDDFVKEHSAYNAVVGLGIYLMSILQDNEPGRMLETIREAGIDITPESLGVTWEDIKKTLDTLTEFVRLEKLPYTILHEKEIPASLLENAKKVITI
jgi:hypothetical protein